MIIKVLVTCFVLFAVSRAYLRYRDGLLSIIPLIFWSVLWAGVSFFVWWPSSSDLLAQSVGIGRGVDVLVYVSIVVLFYGIFRIYIKLEFIERELTSLVRNLSLSHKKNHEPTKENSRHQ